MEATRAGKREVGGAPSWPDRQRSFRPGKRRPLWRRLLRCTEHVLALAGLVLIVYEVAFDVSTVTSPSMSPTLMGQDLDTGDVVLAERVSYWFREPRRWEVVAFRDDLGVQVMKRVVGLPGEAVSLVDGRLAINGEAVRPPRSLRFLRYYAISNLFGGKPYACGDDYYVLGDDSKDSQDSRFEGALSRRRICGRAWIRLRPLYRFGRVNPEQTDHLPLQRQRSARRAEDSHRL